MKSCILLSVLFSWAAMGSSQAPSSPQSASQSSTSKQSTAAPTTGQLKVRGPEAVARQDPKRIVAVIDGNNVTAEQAEAMLKLVPEQQRRSMTSLETAIERLYMLKQFSSDAAKLNLDQQSPWKEQLQFDRENVLAQAYLTRLTNTNSAPQQDPKQYYDTHQGDFDQAKVSGIMVSFNAPGTPASTGATSRTEQQARDKANDLEKKLKAGGDFAALARSDSDNAASASRGGDLGTLSASATNMPADIKTTVFKLQPGQISDPVRVQNGFYIFKVESRTKQSFEQARPEIVQKLQNERNQAALKQQFDKYKIQVKDPDFFNASNTPAPSTPSLQRPSAPSAASSSKPQGPK